MISSEGEKLASKRSGGLATTGSGVAAAAAAAAAQPIAAEKAKTAKVTLMVRACTCIFNMLVRQPHALCQGWVKNGSPVRLGTSIA